MKTGREFYPLTMLPRRYIARAMKIVSPVICGLAIVCTAEWIVAAGPGATSRPTSRPGFRIVAVQPANRSDWPVGVERIDYVSGVDGQKDWATALRPPSLGDWIVFIHGHGSAGDQLYTRPDMRQNWLPLFEQRRMGILTVNLRGNAWMSSAAVQDLHDLLGWARTHYHIRRFIFVGGSMGGTSNLIYAALQPQDADAVVALCPATDLPAYYRWCREQTGPPVLSEIAGAIASSYGGDPKRAASYEEHNTVAHAERLTMPVYVVHGSGDTIIPVSQSRRLAERLAGRASFRYEEIPGGQHDAPLGLVRQGLDWVLSQHP